MASQFVHRALTLFKSMDRNTQAIYRAIIKVGSEASIVDIENAFSLYERHRANHMELLEDMIADTE